jgi:hypothetical protein
MARPQVSLGLDNSGLQQMVLTRLLNQGAKKKDLLKGLELQKKLYAEGTSVEDKRSYALELQQLGFSVDSDLLEPKIDLTPLFDAYGYPEELRQTTQNVFDQKSLTGNGVMEELQKFGTKKPGEISIEDIKLMQKIGGFAADSPMGTMAPEKVKAELDHLRKMDEYVRSEMIKNLSIFSKSSDKQTSKEESIAILDRAVRDAEGKVRPFDEVVNDPKVMIPIAGARMMDDLYGFYGLIPPSAFKGVAATSIFNQAMDTVQERLGNEEKKLALLEEQVAKIRPGSTAETAQKPALEKKLSEQRLTVNELRVGLVDSVSALTERLQMSGIGGGVNPADILPAVNSPTSDRTAEYITQLQQFISSGAIPVDSITDEDWQEAAANGIDIERVKRELGLE